MSPVLRHVSNEIESPESCKAIYSGQVPISDRSHICFSTKNGRGACNVSKIYLARNCSNIKIIFIH